MAKELRKVRVGRVISNKMDKTALIAVRWQQRHPLYKKSMRRISKYYVHDETNECLLGDLVRIEETRPISKTKRWRVLSILERHDVAEVKPVDLDEGLLTQPAEDETDPAEADTAEMEQMEEEDIGNEADEDSENEQ